MKVAMRKEKMTSGELDKEIVLAIQNGNDIEKNNAFAKLFSKYKNIVFHNLSKGVKFNSDVAKDLMMDVFVKINKNFSTYNANEGALSTWIFKITNNTLIDFKRKQRYEVLRFGSLNTSNDNDDNNKYSFQIEDTSIDNNASAVMIKKERADSLIKAISLIKKERTRNLINLMYFEGLSYSEISIETGESEAQVKVLLHRGKIELKKILEAQKFDF